MVLVSEFSNFECIAKSTLYSIKSKKGRLNEYRFKKINGRLYITCDNYKHPFTDEITRLTYRAIEVYGTEYAVIKKLAELTKLSFSTIKGLLYRGAFKNPKNAKAIIKALERMCSEGLF